MKLSKALRIFGYSVVKLATMPVLLTPLHKYLNWYTSFYLFIFQFDLYTFINVQYVFTFTFYNVIISMHFYCGFVFRFVPRFKITFFLFSFSYDNDISLLDILSLADFAGCEHKASLCSSGIAEIFFVSNKVQFNSIQTILLIPSIYDGR